MASLIVDLQVGPTIGSTVGLHDKGTGSTRPKDIRLPGPLNDMTFETKLSSITLGSRSYKVPLRPCTKSDVRTNHSEVMKWTRVPHAKPKKVHTQPSYH